MSYRSRLLALAALVICFVDGRCAEPKTSSDHPDQKVTRNLIVITLQGRIAYAAADLDVEQAEARYGKDIYFVRCDSFDLAIPDGIARPFQMHCVGNVTIRSVDFSARADSLILRGGTATLQSEGGDTQWLSSVSGTRAVSAKSIQFDWSKRDVLQIHSASLIEIAPKKP